MTDSKRKQSGRAGGVAGKSSGFRLGRTATPVGIADILERAFVAPEMKNKVREYAAFPHWEEIVGPEIAAVAMPEKIARGRVLYVRVVDAVWAQELSLMKGQLLEQIRKFGAGAVLEDIRFTVGNPRAFAAQGNKR